MQTNVRCENLFPATSKVFPLVPAIRPSKTRRKVDVEALKKTMGKVAEARGLTGQAVQFVQPHSPNAADR